jgi:2-amino-4-hydroxy-6-hydroxymethyldihydropteridine diphosphokinase
MNIASDRSPQPHIIYLLLGTNLGDRLANLQAAVSALPPDVRPVSISPIYETPPWGFTEQPAFLNQAIRAETDLSPVELLNHLKHLEVKLGRKDNFRYGPRMIDIDILFYDDLTIDTPRLTIPHPRLHERAFALVPLARLAPHLVHPGLGKTIAELLDAVDTTDIRPYSST